MSRHPAAIVARIPVSDGADVTALCEHLGLEPESAFLRGGQHGGQVVTIVPGTRFVGMKTDGPNSTQARPMLFWYKRTDDRVDGLAAYVISREAPF